MSRKSYYIQQEKLSKKTQVITITSIIIKGFIDNYLENIPETKKSKYEKSNIINLFLEMLKDLIKTSLKN